MTVTTHLHTYFHGKLVGEDQFGNRYYTEKTPTSKSKHLGRVRRWVIYKSTPKKWWQKALVFPLLVANRLDNAEPSKVPPGWHSWLHYTIDQPPDERQTRHYMWEKPHMPNLTGTKGAYVPPGHLLKGGHRAVSTSDYEAWKP